MPHQNPQWIGMAISFAIIALVIVLRLRRMGKARPLKLEQLWIVPALIGGIAVWMFWTIPPHGLGWVWCALALAAGGLAGWYRGKTITITVDPQTHAINQTTSPATMIFIILLIALRTGSRVAMIESGASPHSLTIVTDILIAFALGMLSLMRLEMYLRARGMLERARGLR